MFFPAVQGSITAPFSDAREIAVARAADAIVGYLATQQPRTLAREANLIYFTAPGLRWRFRGPGYRSQAAVLDMISAGEIEVQAIAGQFIIVYRLHFTPLYVLMILTFTAGLGLLLLFPRVFPSISCLLWLAPLFVPAVLGSNIAIATRQFRRFLYWAVKQWE